MSTVAPPVSDLLVTTKSREVQRAMLAEARGDRSAAVRHFLAAAHLELVLTDDYGNSGAGDLAVRSQIGAASCFWRAGQHGKARDILRALSGVGPEERAAADEILFELESNCPMAS